jgi:hypothetical protein
MAFRRKVFWLDPLFMERKNHWGMGEGDGGEMDRWW